MVTFPSVVAVPSYKPVDYSWLGNLPNAYRSGQTQQQQIAGNNLKLQQQQQQLGLSQTFAGGLPRNPDGTVNYSAVADKLARGGDISAITTLAPYQPPPASPLLNRFMQVP